MLGGRDVGTTDAVHQAGPFTALELSLRARSPSNAASLPVLRAVLPQCRDDSLFTDGYSLLTLVIDDRHGGCLMDMTKSINLLMICAAFVFVGAMVVGVLN